jgi:hypothetical protein
MSVLAALPANRSNHAERASATLIVAVAVIVDARAPRAQSLEDG